MVDLEAAGAATVGGGPPIPPLEGKRRHEKSGKEIQLAGGTLAAAGRSLRDSDRGHRSGMVVDGSALCRAGGLLLRLADYHRSREGCKAAVIVCTPLRARFP